MLPCYPFVLRFCKTLGARCSLCPRPRDACHIDVYESRYDLGGVLHHVRVRYNGLSALQECVANMRLLTPNVVVDVKR